MTFSLVIDTVLILRKSEILSVLGIYVHQDLHRGLLVVLSSMTINLKDGTRLGGSVSARLTYNNGVMDAEGSAERMIALDEIHSMESSLQTC